MRERATATFRITGWQEEAWNEVDGGPRLTRAHVTKSFDGDLTGEGNIEYLMVHFGDGRAVFFGFERVVGTLGGRPGSFVLRHEGTFENGTARARWRVVPGSGAGELTGLAGEGGFTSAHAEEYVMTLDYEFS